MKGLVCACACVCAFVQIFLGVCRGPWGKDEQAGGIQKHLLPSGPSSLSFLFLSLAQFGLLPAESKRHHHHPWITFSICRLHLRNNESHRCVNTCMHTHMQAPVPNTKTLTHTIPTNSLLPDTWKHHNRRTNRDRHHVPSWMWFKGGDIESRCCHCSEKQKRASSNKIWEDIKGKDLGEITWQSPAWHSWTDVPCGRLTLFSLKIYDSVCLLLVFIERK